MGSANVGAFVLAGLFLLCADARAQIANDELRALRLALVAPALEDGLADGKRRAPEEQKTFLRDCSDIGYTCHDANENVCGTIKVGACWQWSTFSCEICTPNHAADCNAAFPQCCQGQCETNCEWSVCQNELTGCQAAICRQCMQKFNCRFSYNQNEQCTGGTCVEQSVYSCDDGQKHWCWYESGEPPDPPGAR